MKHISARKGIVMVIHTWMNGEVNTQAAAVAYYTLFALAPLLLITIAIGGIVFDTVYIKAQILTQFEGTLGPNTIAFISVLLDQNVSKGNNIVLIIVGVIFVIFGAMGIFSALQRGLNLIFGIKKKREKGIWKFILEQIVSVSMVFSLGLAVLISLVVSTLLVSFGKSIDRYISQGDIVVFYLEFIISFTIIASLLTFIIKLLPSQKVPWKIACTGGIVATIFFMLGKYALGYYLGNLGVETTYGAASSVIAFILWSYYLAQVFFISVIVAKTSFNLDKDKVYIINSTES